MRLLIEHALRDARHAARQLARTPAFTTIAVAALGIAIGVTTTIFGFLNVLIFRPIDANVSPAGFPPAVQVEWIRRGC